MQSAPDFGDFERAYDAGLPQVVWTSIVADLETPVSAMLKLAAGRPNSFLFESVEGGAVRGRYSLIGMKPDLIWRCNHGIAEVNRDIARAAERFEADDRPPLDSLRALIEESRIELPEDLPPMAAGLFGYMGYDMVRYIERLPDDNPDVLGVPEGLFIRPSIMAIFDNIEDEVTIVTPVRPAAGVSAQAAYEAAHDRLGAVLADFERSLAHQPPLLNDDYVLPEPGSNVSHERFHEMVERAREYILAGDAFQIVPSQRFAVPFPLPPMALYRALRRLNPSPFLFYLDFGDFSIVGSSPEILVRLRDGRVVIRPLAGTRPRGASRAEDEALERELLADPKERAEHLMLLDLARNDVGRVAEIGTVEVLEQFVIERYSHVMHISSDVEGKLRDGLDAMDALAAGFPAGTVSGAPKVRAMEIIEELEPDRRGIYAGCIGYFSANGSMDNCIALRTAVVKDGTMYVQAGVGVVADSDPEAEYQESIAKARALFRAAEEAVRFASRSRTN
jgi:anthranilate synthase component 1